MRAIWALAIKDLRLLGRDRAGLFLTFAWPLILACFFGALGPGFGAALEDDDERAMIVASVDEVDDPDSRALLAELDAHPRIELEPTSLAQARERVRLGERPAFVHVRAVDQVELGVDPRRASEAQVLEAALELAAFRAADPEAAAIVIERHPVQAARADLEPPTPFAVTFPQGILWAVLACAATFAVGLVNERNTGTLLRLAVAPLPRWHLLAGKAVACGVAIAVMEVVLIAVAVVGFGVRPQSWGLLILALACTNLGFVGLMTLLAAIGRKTASAAGLSWAILMSLAMLGGGMLPLFMMPGWLRTAAAASPVAWALHAIEGAVWRGFSLAEVAPYCAALLALAVVSLVLGSRAVRDL